MSSVTDTLARFIIALDDHDWDDVASHLGETVHRDYQSLIGAPSPTRSPARPSRPNGGVC